MPVNILPAIAIFRFVFYLVVFGVVGIVLSLLTVPVFWYSRYGFVPRRYVLEARSFGDGTFLVFVRVAVGTVYYVTAATLATIVAWRVGHGPWVLAGTFAPVGALAWAAIVPWPLRSTPDRRHRWLAISTGSFALYVAGSLGPLLLVEAVV